MASRKLSDLVPELEVKAKRILIICGEKEIPILITCTARLVREQVALYAQGREPLNHVNYLRGLVGMTPLTIQENKRKVTWTLNSNHLVDLDDGNPANDKSRAFDFCILKGQQPIWDLKIDVNDNDIPDYREVGEIAEAMGLKWGGRWKKRPDYPHIELS